MVSSFGQFVFSGVALAASTLHSPICACLATTNPTISPAFVHSSATSLFANPEKRTTKRRSRGVSPPPSIPKTECNTKGYDAADGVFDFSDDAGDKQGGVEDDDTIRVRIWRALASGQELSLKQLGKVVGERKDLKSHLVHVEKQAKNLKNKKKEWFQRRGLISQSTTSSEDDDDEDVLSSNIRRTKKLRLVKRRGNKGETYIRLA